MHCFQIKLIKAEVHNWDGQCEVRDGNVFIGGVEWRGDPKKPSCPGESVYIEPPLHEHTHTHRLTSNHWWSQLYLHSFCLIFIILTSFLHILFYHKVFNTMCSNTFFPKGFWHFKHFHAGLYLGTTYTRIYYWLRIFEITFYFWSNKFLPVHSTFVVISFVMFDVIYHLSDAYLTIYISAHHVMSPTVVNIRCMYVLNSIV